MKKLFYILMLLFPVVAFAGGNIVKVGTYNGVKWTKREMGWLNLMKGIYYFTGGSQMVLNVDSSFKYMTCSTIYTGNWYSINDSLFLKVKTVRWRIDSLNQYGFHGKWPNLPVKPIGFKIKDNHLDQTLQFANGKIGIERLKLNVP